MRLQITLWKWLPYLPGANELNSATCSKIRHRSLPLLLPSPCLMPSTTVKIARSTFSSTSTAVPLVRSCKHSTGWSQFSLQQSPTSSEIFPTDIIASRHILVQNIPTLLKAPQRRSFNVGGIKYYQLISKVHFSSPFCKLIPWALPMKLVWGEGHSTSMMVSQYWFR